MSKYFDNEAITRLERGKCLVDDTYAHCCYVNQDLPYLQEQYFQRTGKILNLEFPQTFNEKLQWLKLFWRDELAYKYTDKYTIPSLLDKLGCPEIAPKRFCTFDSANDISFDALPQSFVLKATHASGYNLFITDKSKIDIERVRHLFARLLSIRYYALKYEWPYENIKPRVLCEPLLEIKPTEPLDYKFHCFNGEVKMIEILNVIDKSSDTKEPDEMLVDKNFNILPFSFGYMNNAVYPRPHNFDRMVCYAETLSRPFPYVRVDLLNHGGEHISMGEFTFFPGAGYDDFFPANFQYNVGCWLKLPIDIK